MNETACQESQEASSSLAANALFRVFLRVLSDSCRLLKEADLVQVVVKGLRGFRWLPSIDLGFTWVWGLGFV